MCVLSPQATGADCVHRGQCGRSRHRADAVHQRGLLQAQEAAARLASDGLHRQTSTVIVYVLTCLMLMMFDVIAVCFLPETVLKFRSLKKPAQLAVINSLEKVLLYL